MTSSHRMMSRFLAPLCVLLLAAGPTTAHAHLVSTRFGDFYGGALHPLTALEHVLPWLTMGTFAGMQEPKCGRWILLAFPVGLAAGTALALVIHEEPLVSTLNIASFVLVGTLVAAAWRLPKSLLVILGVAMGLSHGYENGTAMTAETNKLLFVSGVACVGYVVITLATAATLTFLRGEAWRQIALRALGSWVTAIGLMLLAFRLAAR